MKRLASFNSFGNRFKMIGRDSFRRIALTIEESLTYCSPIRFRNMDFELSLRKTASHRHILRKC